MEMIYQEERRIYIFAQDLPMASSDFLNLHRNQHSKQLLFLFLTARGAREQPMVSKKKTYIKS
jgi:hypothetical protein